MPERRTCRQFSLPRDGPAMVPSQPSSVRSRDGLAALRERLRGMPSQRRPRTEPASATFAQARSKQRRGPPSSALNPARAVLSNLHKEGFASYIGNEGPSATPTGLDRQHTRSQSEDDLNVPDSLSQPASRLGSATLAGSARNPPSHAKSNANGSEIDRRTVKRIRSGLTGSWLVEQSCAIAPP